MPVLRLDRKVLGMITDEDIHFETASVQPDPAMVALYVLAKRNGRWWSAARQTTLTAAQS